MLLRFEDGRPFAQGASKYGYRPITKLEKTPRIFVTVKIQGISTEAVVDTGGVYLICNPEIADLLDLDPAGELGTDKVKTSRWGTVPGTLHRLCLELLAEEGKGIKLQATAFVPRLQPNELWNLPSFMGLSGCLERIRFAVDPVTDTFYFGAIDERG